VRSLTCTLHTDAGLWERLRADWDRLLAESPDSTPSQSSDFLRLWWQHLAERRELRVFVVEDSGRPVLIFPLQLSPRRWYGVPLRWLEPLGMLDQINRPRLALGRLDPQAYACGFDAIGSRSDWHVIRIDEKPPDDPELQLLEAFAARTGLRYLPEPFDPCAVINLQQPWSAYLSTRSAKFRKNLRACTRRLEAAGQARLDIARTPADIESAFDTLVDIHTRSWKHWPRYGLSHSTELQQFYRKLLALMAAKGCARVLTLSLDSRPMAATFALMDRDTYYSFEIAHDPQFERYSPGTLLESMELQGLMDEGVYRRYDPMSGAYGNKMRWAESMQPMSLVCVMRTTPVTRTHIYVEYRLRPAVTRLCDRLGILEPVRKVKERIDRLRSRYFD
jgi:CelD/BcsL family acetyltransferase involved in cellulose biosynthesis